MSLLRSESGDGSINFQKASCTLDGCIKVWTSRVDSVVVETGKLLSGLQDDLDLRTSKKGKEAEDEEDGEEDEEGNTKSKKRKGKAREATLAKNFSQLAIKKLDVEFSVDPLFKKTSADFDEGGAGGLLMNHLGVDGKARIVFDASDVAGVADEGDEQDALPADGDADREATPLASAQQDHEMVDLTKLRVTLFGHDEVAFSGSENALSALLSQRTICPTFASFRFAPDDTTPFSALSFEHAPGNDGYSDPAYDDSMGGMPAFDDMPEGDEGEDFFGAGNDYAGGDDGDDIFAAPLDVRQGSHDADDDDELAAIAHDQPRGSAAAPSQRDLALAFVGVGAAQDEEAEGGADGMFDYFDQHLVKNWAGPEHWKMRKGVGAMPGAKGECLRAGLEADIADTSTGADADGPSGSSAPKAAPRKSKEAFVIDFTTPAGAMSSAELFAPAKGGVGIMLPRNKGAADLHLLPEDRHFSSRELLRLAIKPRAVVSAVCGGTSPLASADSVVRLQLNLRRRGARVAQTNDVDMAHPADVDEEFWAQAAAEREQGVGGAYDGECSSWDGHHRPVLIAHTPAEHEAQPFNTEFFHDADDDGAFDMLEDGGPSGFGDEGEEEELPTQAIRRIRPEYVNYAKRAKRVDVKRLKDSIWKELAIDVDALSDEEDDEVSVTGVSAALPLLTPLQPSTPGRTKPEPGSSGPRTFSAVISGLKKSYAKEKLDEISTSYCFICLLHLANEEGLDIRIDDAAPSSSQKRVAKNEAPLDKELGEENMEGIFRRLAASAAQGVLDDEDAGGEEGDGDGGLRVGRLENLVIVNDRNAGRGA
jgi:condensin complex subunit 2